MRLTKNLEKHLFKMASEISGLDIFQDDDSDEYVNFSYIQEDWSEEVFIEIMNWWVNYIDNKIDQEKELSEEYVEFFNSRGFNYYEFKALFDLTIKEEDFKYFRIFNFLGINDEIQRKKTIQPFEYDFPSYYELLSFYNIPIWDFFLHSKMPVYFPKSALKRHTYIVSETGNGKSQLMNLVFYDLQRISNSKLKNGHYKNSLILIDPHGDLAEQALKFVLNKGHERVIYIDPYINKALGVKEEYTPIINPFDIKDKSEQNLTITSQELTKAFEEIIKGGGNFSTHMDAILNPCIATLLWMENTTIKDLQNFMNDATNEKVY